MARRLDYCYRTNSKFPVGTDSLEGLVELEVDPKDSKLVEKLIPTSWSLATIGAWCVVLDLEDHYAALTRGAAGPYDAVCVPSFGIGPATGLSLGTSGVRWIMEKLRPPTRFFLE